MAIRVKRGASGRRLDFLAKLRPLLRASVDPERMVRSVASLLAVEVGQYCIVDWVDKRGTIRRLECEHADASRRARLRVLCDDARFEEGSRVPRLVASGGAEILSRVSEQARQRSLPDVTVLDGERVRSYMAASVVVKGVTVAVFTLVVTHGTRRYDESDLAFLVAVADWTGLGLENSPTPTRREAQPRTSSGTMPRVSLPPRTSSGFSAEEASTAVRRTTPLRKGG